ncbi:hypothetical protein F5B20DRAFT_258687 [Whalleya microplaca]|nr:hypothetical protein F5B20DRAFT_258687 [Whalleya microplaca]
MALQDSPERQPAPGHPAFESLDPIRFPQEGIDPKIIKQQYIQDLIDLWESNGVLPTSTNAQPGSVQDWLHLIVPDDSQENPPAKNLDPESLRLHRIGQFIETATHLRYLPLCPRIRCDNPQEWLHLLCLPPARSVPGGSPTDDYHPPEAVLAYWESWGYADETMPTQQNLEAPVLQAPSETTSHVSTTAEDSSRSVSPLSNNQSLNIAAS